MTSGNDPLLGRRLEGRYHVLRHLADGGMGSVYVAHDERLDRDVALKVLRRDLARDPAFVARFRREAQAAARLTNPHVVAVHDQGEDAGDIFLAMELVRGRTLRQLLRQADTTYAQRLEIFDQLLAGLDAAHAQGLAHRDIKPENVLIDETGHVKVADFGLARAISSSTADSDVLLGTASYLSPEQVERGHADTRSDVYSCGLVLFEILSGRRAFEGTVPINVAYQHVHEPVPTLPSTVPEASAADRLIARACAKNPSARPSDAEQLRTDFRAFRDALNAASLTAFAPAAVSSAQNSQAPTQSHTAQLPHGATRAFPSTRSDAEHQPRRWWPLGAALGVIILVLAWLFLLGPFGPREVPDVHGQAQGQAVERLRSAGFDVEVQQRNDDRVAAGRVIDTSPESGSHRWPFGPITLDVSTGPRIVTVPNVHGSTEAAARKTLAQSHLSVRNVVRIFDVSAAGTAVGTVPAPGTQLRHDSAVTLRVSKGPRPVAVPQVTRLNEQQATALLTREGLKPTITRSPSDDVPAGQVVSTNPGPGATLHTGDSLTVTVSSGKEMVSVPDVTGMSAGDARATLEDAGFSVSGPSWLDVLFNRTVATQSPSGGASARAPKGSTVTLGF